MKIILLEELKGKGGEGDVVDVSAGFANNYLLSEGIAVLATPGNLKQLEQRKANIAKREEVRIADANALKEKLEGLAVKVDAQIGEEGQLFGSVTPVMIADALLAQYEIEVDRRRIDLASTIKRAGTYEALVSIYREIKATLTILVGVEAPGLEYGEKAPEVVEEAAEEAVEEAAEEAAEEVAEEAAE